MDKIHAFMRSTAGRIGVASAAAIGVVVALATQAGAAVDTAISSGFTSSQTNLIDYMGLAVALVVALLLIGSGLRLLVKWVKHAVRAS